MYELPPKRKRGRSPTGSETTPRPPGVHKRGKRIVSLLATLQHDSNSHHSSNLPGAGSAPTSGGSTQASLLGVAGLTRQALDGCVASYFGSARHITRLSLPQDQFSRSVRVMLYETAGLEVPKDLVGVEAVSVLLALVVAALGASSSSSYAGLAGALLERCVELASDGEYLVGGGLDDVEAVNLLVDVPGRHRTGLCHSTPSNPLALDPLGRGYPVEMALYHSLTVRPVLGDQVLDYARRESLFWIIWSSDALRSSTIGAPCAMAETDIGWPWPNTAPEDSMQLARVARHIGRRLLSPRPRGIGLLNDDVRTAVNELDVLSRTPHTDIAWLQAQAGANELSVPAVVAALATRNVLYVVCWAAAKCDAAQHPRNLSTRTLDMVEAAALKATEHMVPLAETIIQARLVRPTVVSSRIVSCVVFLIHRLAECTQKNRAERTTDIMANAEALISAAVEMDCYSDTAAVGAALRDGLGRATASQPPEAPSTIVRDLVATLAGHDIQTPFTALVI